MLLLFSAPRRGRGLKWEYIPEESAVLLDKIYKFDRITTFELGGEAAERVLHEKGAYAVHTTCYEQKSKVMGLKVSDLCPTVLIRNSWLRLVRLVTDRDYCWMFPGGECVLEPSLL